MTRFTTQRCLVLFFSILLVADYGPQHALANERGFPARKRRKPVHLSVEHGPQQVFVADESPPNFAGASKRKSKSSESKSRMKLSASTLTLTEHGARTADSIASGTPAHTKKKKSSQSKSRITQSSARLDDCDDDDCGSPGLSHPAETPDSKAAGAKGKSHSKSKSRISNSKGSSSQDDEGDYGTHPSTMSYPANPASGTIGSSGKASSSKGCSGKGFGKGSSSKGSSRKGSSGKSLRRHRYLTDRLPEQPDSLPPDNSRKHGHLRNSNSPPSNDPERPIKNHQRASTLAVPTSQKPNRQLRHESGTSLRKRKDQGAVDPPPLLGHPTIQDLQRVETRYYMYDDCDILQCDLLDELRKRGSPQNPELDHISTDARAEADVIKALKDHPLRTTDPEKASLYIVPLPLAELIAYGCQWEDCIWFEESFEALFDHPIFKRHHGNGHVLISQHWAAFNRRFPTRLPGTSDSIETVYWQLL
jgi:hypothetical protein